MDIRLSDEQRMTKDTFDRFFARECPSDLLRELEEGEGHSPEVWRKLAAMGGMALNLPEEYGGFEGDFFDTVLLYEAMGHALYPSPHLWTVVVGAELLLRCGSERQKADFLPRIADGTAILTLALAEWGDDDPAAVQTEAIPFDDGFRLAGQKRFVEFASLADHLLVVARCPEPSGRGPSGRGLVEGRAPAGVTLFLVPTDREGLALTRHSEISGGQFYRVTLTDVVVSGDEALGPVGRGLGPLEEVLDRARVALAARMVGGAQGAFDLTLKYTKEREQFGQRIATFQHIAFRLAQLQTRIDGARLLVYRTAWLVDQGESFAHEAAMAKSLASDLVRHAAAEAVQLHGGFGYMEEADPQLYFRRATVDAVRLGTASALRERVADGLGLWNRVFIPSY